MNNINLIGRLTRDWERDDNSRYIKSALAVDLGHEKTMYINLVSFNEKTMDATENYTAKGSQVGISGTLTSDNYTDNNGNKRTSYSVICNRIDFLSGSRQEPQEKTNIDDYPTNDKYHDDKDGGALWD